MPGEAKVPERCLLYLLDHADAVEESPEADALVQHRIAESLGIRRAHVSRALVRFLAKGFVRTAHVHVRGGARRRLAYFLTDAGMRHAKEVRRRLEERPIIVVAEDGSETKRRLYEVPALLSRRPPFSDLVVGLQRGRLDLREFRDRQARVRGGKVFDVSEAAASPHFQGREGEIERLRSFLSDPRARGCLLIGLPGIGKTALAAQWASDLQGRAHVLWRRVRPEMTVRDLHNEVAELLRAAGRPALLETLRDPTDSSRERVLNLLRRDLADLKAVIILDDAHVAPDAVHPLVRDAVILAGDAGLKILVLARQRIPVFSPADFALGRAWEIELDDLRRDEAEALLQALRVDPQRRDEILRKCGGHPLLLELASRGGVPLEGLRRVSAARLAQEVLANVKAGDRGPLELAAVFNGPIPQKTLGRAANDFIQQCLIREIGEGRLGMHDLVREAVLAAIPAERLDTLHTRAAEILARSGDSKDTLAALQHLLAGGRYTDAQELLVARGEDLILAGHAEVVGRYLEDVLRVRTDPRTLLLRGHVLFARGLWADAARAYSAVPKGADPLTSAEALLGAGKSEHHRESRLALGILVKARDSLERLGTLRLLAESEYWIGGVYESAGQLAEALNAYEKGRAVAFDVGDRRWEGTCAYGIGRILSLRGEYAQAVEQELDALHLLERAGSRLDVAKVCAGLGGNLLEVRRLEEAETYLRRAASEAREIGAVGTLTSALYNLASLKTISRRIPEAIGFFEEATELYETQEKYDRAAWSAAWLAHCHWVLGNDVRAEEAWQRAQRYLGKSPMPALRVRALRRLAAAAVEAGKADRGTAMLERALKEARTARLDGLVLEVESDLANLESLAAPPN